MSIDLSGLSAKELEALINQAKKRKTQLSKRKSAAAVRRKVLALLKAEGYTLAELFGGAAKAPAAPRKAAAKPGKARKGGKVPPKYRNPDDPAQTWAGRGVPPRWLAALLAQGRKLEEFLIK